MYAIILLICTACGGGNAPTPPPQGEPEKSPPEITLLGDSNVELRYGEEYQDAGATASDAEDGNITDQIVTAGLPIPSTTPGDYIVQYQVSDSDGAETSAKRTVIVRENYPPVLSLNGGASLEVIQSSVFKDPGATASDPEDGDLSARVEVSGNVDVEKLGEYLLQYRVDDSAGEQAVETRVVTVVAKPSPYAHIPITNDKEGFTTLLPSSNSRLIYVSMTRGDDSNDGLSPESPVKTISRGKKLLRDGSPDWMLLKVGDSWPEGLGRWTKSGRSDREPMVVTAYGEGNQRPRLESGTRDGLRASGGGGTPKTINNLVISGLHFYANGRDPESSNLSEVTNSRGINWFRGTTFLLIEDNYFKGYKEGIQIDDLDDLNISGVVIRKNVIVDSFATDAHSQGMYVAKTEGVLIEENIFDHNGWHGSFPGAQPTKFNHSIYIQGNNLNVEIRENIISRSSSHGMQLRPGGIISGNFLIRNPISIFLGRSDVDQFDGSVTGNIVLNGNDIGPGDMRRGWGIDFGRDINAIIENNIVAHVFSDSGSRFAIKEWASATYKNNVVYKWGEGASDPKSYPDPERTIEEYDALMGGEGTFDSFIDNVRAQSRLDWNPDYSIENIKQFFRNGFGS